MDTLAPNIDFIKSVECAYAELGCFVLASDDRLDDQAIWPGSNIGPEAFPLKITGEATREQFLWQMSLFDRLVHRHGTWRLPEFIEGERKYGEFPYWNFYYFVEIAD